MGGGALFLSPTGFLSSIIGCCVSVDQLESSEDSLVDTPLGDLRGLWVPAPMPLCWQRNLRGPAVAFAEECGQSSLVSPLLAPPQVGFGPSGASLAFM